MKLLESVTLGNDERKSIKQLWQLQTIKKTVAFTISADGARECFKNTIDLLPEGKTYCHNPIQVAENEILLALWMRTQFSYAKY